MDTPTLVTLGIAGLGFVVSNGFVMKLVVSSFRESMRETFLTKEAASDKYLSKAEAAEKIDNAKQEMWERVSDHVITPLNNISNRIDDLFKFIGHGQADGTH